MGQMHGSTRKKALFIAELRQTFVTFFCCCCFMFFSGFVFLLSVVCVTCCEVGKSENSFSSLLLARGFVLGSNSGRQTC